MVSNRLRWTDAEVAILRKETANGSDAAAIAKLLNRTELAVMKYGKLAAAREYFRLGMNLGDASQKAGLPRDTLVRIRNGRLPAPVVLTDEDRLVHYEAASKPRCTDCGKDATDHGIIEPTKKVRRGRRIWRCAKCAAVYRFPIMAPVSGSRISVFGPSG